MGTITASSAGTWRASSRPTVAVPSAIVRPSKGWIRGASFVGLDGTHGLEGSVHVRHQHKLRAITAHLGDAEGVGAFHHHHLGRGADAVRGEGDGDGMVARAHRSDAPRPRRIVESERAEQRAPRLERAGALEELQLEEDRAVRPECVRDGSSPPVVHRGLVDQTAERRAGLLDRGEIGRGQVLLSHPPLLPAEARRALPR